MVCWCQRYLGSCRRAADYITDFGFTTWSCSEVSLATCCASCSDLVSLREDPEITKGLFISLSIYPFFHTVALFPKLTSVLELIEYDPLTAAWNNKASFPHILSPRMASLSYILVHIKVPYQCGIWGWRNYWSQWEARTPYLLLLHLRRDGIMGQKAMLSESGDNSFAMYCVFVI